MKLWFYSIFFACCLFTSYSTAQNVKSEADTNVKSLISEGEGVLESLRKQQYDDSIRRVYLENQLISSQRPDTDEKHKLLLELNLLRSRDSLLMARRRLKVDSLRAINNGVPVAPFRDTLFTIFNAIGSYSAAERASGIATRIRQLESNYDFKSDSLRIQQTEDNWLLLWRDQVILSVNQQDALWANQEAGALIAVYKSHIGRAIDEYREENSFQRLLTSAGIAILIVVCVVLLIMGLSRLLNGLKRKILRVKGQRFNGINIRGYELISAAQQVKFFWALAGLFRWCLILTIVYLALPILFNLFPATQGYASVLLGYFLAPLKKVGMAVINYFPNLITIIVVCLVFHYILKLLKFFANELQSGALTIGGFYQEWALPTYQILRVLLLAFLLVVIFPYLPGSDSPIFKGISVFIGVLFTFSSAGALGNIVAGLLLTYMRSFAIGDRIRIGEVTGDIVEKSLLVTRVLTANNEVISIPNAQILNSHTINYSTEAATSGLIINTKLTMAYEIPWQTVHELAKAAVGRVSFLEKHPEPFILQSSLDDFYVTYQINAYTKHPNKQAFIYSELHKHILDVFHEAGIEILSPHFHAMRDGSQRDIPEAHRGDSLHPFVVQVKKSDAADEDSISG